MKKTIFILLYFSLFTFHFSFSQSWLWARSAGGTVGGGSDAEGNSIATDSSGNIYIGGSFDNTTLFFGSDTLTNYSGYDHILIVKYDSGGNVLWAKSAGGTRSDQGDRIITDANGNSYLTGDFTSPLIIFGSDTLTNVNNSDGDVFLTKYDANGNVLWAQCARGITQPTGAGGSGLAFDVFGNVYLTGEYNSPTIIFGSDTLMNNGTNNLNMFLVKYDTGGNVIWAKSGFEIGQGSPTNLAIDTLGNLYVSGDFAGPIITFGSDTLQGPNGDGNMFFAKYDMNGNVLWAITPGGSGQSQPMALAIDNGGDVYVTGWFGVPYIIFGSDTLFCNHQDDIFLVKYDANGNALWAESADGPGSDQAWGAAVTPTGNIVITGNFETPYIAFGADTIYNKGLNDIFLAGYTSNDNFLSTISTGGGLGTDYSHAVTVTKNSDIYITGSYEDTLAFNTDTLFPNPGTFYVAKLSGGVISGLNRLILKNEDVRIFPNPNNGTFTLSLSNVNEKCNIEIYNVLGEKIYNTALPKTQDYTINLTGQPNGIYFYRVISESGGLEGEGKVVIEK